MSVKMMGAVFDANLPRDEKYVLLSYADHAAHDGTSIYPSVARMAWKTGYSRRSIQTITTKLVEKGILMPDGKGKHGVNRYRMDTSDLPEREAWEVQFLHPAENDTEGVQKTTPGGAESALNPSLTVNDRSSFSGANAPPPPPPPATPEPVQEKKQPTPAQATFTALAEVCQIDLTTMTAKQRGALNQSEKTLRHADADPANKLAAFGTWWYAYDWRGKRGEPPRPHQVRETWGQFIIYNNGGHDARQSSNPRAPNYRPPLATRAV